MKSRRHYIKKETKGQIIFLVFILLAIAIGLIWNELERAEFDKVPPDVTLDMPNASINWSQSYHPGGWSDAT